MPTRRRAAPSPEVTAASGSAPVRRRPGPLVAPGRTPPASVDAPTVRSTTRGLRVGLGVGLGATVSVAALIFAIAAIPLFLLAQVSPDGRDRPEFRTALVVAVAIGAAIGLGAGIAAGIWAGRGGRLPTDRAPFLES